LQVMAETPQQDYKKLYEDLKASDKMKTEFLQVISHELRTPITPIMGFVSMLFSGRMGPLTAQQRMAVEVIANECEHLTKIVDKLKEFSKMEGKNG